MHVHFRETMAIYYVIVMFVAAVVTADTGANYRISEQQSTCSIPVDVITELHNLRSLLNQESKMSLDLGKQVLDLQKELLELRKEYSTASAPNQETNLTIYLGKEVLDLQKEIDQLRTQCTSTGSVFTRWGRAACPENTSELIYSGKYLYFVCILGITVVTL